MDVVKLGTALAVTVVAGVPQCPHCHQPMRDRGDGTWDCPVWGPLVDAVRADADVLFDSVLR